MIHDEGIEWFRAKVEEYYGSKLADCTPDDVREHNDHMGWDQQGDGKWFYGFNVEMAFLNTPEYNQPVLAVGSRFAMPKSLTPRQKSRVRENELLKKHYYTSPSSNVARARMHARRRHF